MLKKTERRYVPIEELRVSSDSEKPKIEGYAAVFNSLSENFGGWREQIAPGAFAETIKTADVRALIDHDPSKIIGRTKSGTLQLSEDSKGLLAKIDPPDTQAGRDIVESIKRGDVSGMSFGFIVKEESWDFNSEEDYDLRTLKQVDLFDVSPVTFPAYPDTAVGTRSHEENKPKPEQKVKNGELMRMKLELTEAENSEQAEAEA